MHLVDNAIKGFVHLEIPACVKLPVLIFYDDPNSSVRMKLQSHTSFVTDVWHRRANVMVLLRSLHSQAKTERVYLSASCNFNYSEIPWTAVGKTKTYMEEIQLSRVPFEWNSFKKEIP